MKNHRFLWLRNRTTDNRKCEKARNIKEKRTIEIFSTVSKPRAELLSSPSVELYFCKHSLRWVLVFLFTENSRLCREFKIAFAMNRNGGKAQKEALLS